MQTGSVESKKFHSWGTYPEFGFLIYTKLIECEGNNTDFWSFQQHITSFRRSMNTEGYHKIEEELYVFKIWWVGILDH